MFDDSSQYVIPPSFSQYDSTTNMESNIDQCANVQMCKCDIRSSKPKELDHPYYMFMWRHIRFKQDGNIEPTRPSSKVQCITICVFYRKNCRAPIANEFLFAKALLAPI
jgi:hypothetical protein